MQFPSLEVGLPVTLNATGVSVVTSANAAVVGVAFYGSGTGGIQFFAGTTGSASLTPLITFSATASALQNGLSPFFLRVPLMVSGAGFFVKVAAAADPQLTLYWLPVGGP